jgi:uncharacterized protein
MASGAPGSDTSGPDSNIRDSRNASSDAPDPRAVDGSPEGEGFHAPLDSSPSSATLSRETSDPQALLEDSKRRLGVDPTSVTRPVPELLRYYRLSAAFTLILFPLVFLPAYFRYRSLRYRIDDEGVSMSWGILNKREVFLTYRRLQDIQMTQGFIQRKFGLADLHLHTASGSSGAEMKLEGLPDPEAFRDYLYARMRGAEDGVSDATSSPETEPVSRTHTAPPASRDADPHTSAAGSGPRPATGGGSDEALALLQEIRDELRQVNRRFDGREGPGS